MNFTKIAGVLTCALSCAMVLGNTAQAGIVCTDCILCISTGYKESKNKKIPNFQNDPQWVFGAGSVPAYVGLHPKSTDDSFVPPAWLDDNASADSRWLSVFDEPNYTFIVPSGTYFFETSFDLTGYIPSSVRLHEARYAADNRLARIFINGIEVWTNPSSAEEEFASFIDLPDDLGAGAFTTGINTLRFEVQNLGGPNCPTPAGLRFEGCFTGECEIVPEPSTGFMALAGVAMIGAARLRRRRR